MLMTILAFVVTIGVLVGAGVVGAEQCLGVVPAHVWSDEPGYIGGRRDRCRPIEQAGAVTPRQHVVDRTRHFEAGRVDDLGAGIWEVVDQRAGELGVAA